MDTKSRSGKTTTLSGNFGTAADAGYMVARVVAASPTAVPTARPARNRRRRWLLGGCMAITPWPVLCGVDEPKGLREDLSDVPKNASGAGGKLGIECRFY